MGWFPLYIDRYVAVSRYWNRLVQMNENRLTKSIFNSIYDNVTPWCKKVKQIFTEIDYLEDFENKARINVTDFEERLQSNYVEKWKQEIDTKPKLRTYSIFKTSFETDNYVRYIHNKGMRSLTAQFRVGILPLAVETGRFKRITLEERICFMCPDSVEDEKHLLLYCPIYTNQRNVLFGKAIELDPSFATFNDNTKIKFIIENMWKEFSLFLSQSWPIRQSQLYH